MPSAAEAERVWTEKKQPLPACLRLLVKFKWMLKVSILTNTNQLFKNRHGGQAQPSPHRLDFARGDPELCRTGQEERGAPRILRFPINWHITNKNSAASVLARRLGTERGTR